MSVIKVANLTSPSGWADGGLMTGATLGGFLAAHAAQSFLFKSESGLVFGGMALAGLAGTVAFESAPLQALSAGLAVYGIIRGLKVLLSTAPTAEPSAVSGLIPESAKMALSKFIPSLSGDEELDPGMTGDEDLGDLEDTLTGLGNTEVNLTAGYSGINDMAPTQNSFGNVASKLI